MHELALFAGAGGGILASQLLGDTIVCAVERDAYAAQVLAQRQNDGVLEAFPIWSDITTFDGRPWRGIADVISGGFPCQDISAAGKGAGISGERSGLWKEMVRIISEVRPIEVRVENSPMLTSRGLGTVLGDLAALGFDAEWGVLSAADVGANHRRERIWILAHSQLRGVPLRWGIGNAKQNNFESSGVHCNEQAGLQGKTREILANTMRNTGQRFVAGCFNSKGRKRPFKGQIGSCGDGLQWWATEPDVGRVADGVAFRVDRLKGIGNGQVPLCAATAFELLRARLDQ